MTVGILGMTSGISGMTSGISGMTLGISGITLGILGMTKSPTQLWVTLAWCYNQCVMLLRMEWMIQHEEEC